MQSQCAEWWTTPLLSSIKLLPKKPNCKTMKQTTETFCTTVGRKMMWVYLWSIKWCVICPWIFNYCQIRLPSWLLHAFLNISLGFRWTPASGLTSLRAPRTWWGACWCLTLLRESLSMRLSTTPGWRQDHKTHTHTHMHILLAFKLTECK